MFEFSMLLVIGVSVSAVFTFVRVDAIYLGIGS